MRTAESIQFRAIAVRKNGASEEVRPQWAVSSASLSVEASSGLTLGGTPGTAELRASLDGVSGIRSVKVVPDMRGAWNGTLVIDCTSGDITWVGEGPGVCKTPTISNTARLQIDTQVGDVAVGAFTYLGGSGSFASKVGLNGSWDWPGFTSSSLTDTGYYYATFRDWHLTPQAAASGEMAGAGVLERTYTNAWGPQHWVFGAVTMTLKR